MCGGKKKSFKLDTFKHTGRMGPEYAEKKWKLLEQAIHDIYYHKATSLHFEELYRERKGDAIDHRLMGSTIRMFMDLGPAVYQDDFEKPFLVVSANFYSIESQNFIECCDCGEYLKKAERMLNEEMERVSHYLDATTEVKITYVVETEMIENHMHRLVHMESSGLVNMLMDDKYDDLSRMYNLFQRVPNGLSTMRDVMISRLQETGKQLVAAPERIKDPVEYVQRLLEKVKYDKIINLAFSNGKTFRRAVDSSFECFINLNAMSP